MGLVHPDKVRRNADAQAGDVLDARQAARRRRAVGGAQEGRSSTPRATRSLIANTTQLNKPGIALAAHGRRACADRRHRLRPAGHALEMARGAGLRGGDRLVAGAAAAGVAQMAADGFVTGASGRNWAGYGAEVRSTRPCRRSRATC